MSDFLSILARRSGHAKNRSGRPHFAAPGRDQAQAPKHSQQLSDDELKAVFLFFHNSGLFDASYYTATYPEITKAGVDPLRHFYFHGYLEGRRPNPIFDPTWYLATYSDVKSAGKQPLLHYAFLGEREGRQPSQLFNPTWYRETYAIPNSQNALSHYLRNRIGRFSPIPEFDARYYLESYKDVAAARIDPFEHFLVHGYKDGKNPSKEFNTRFYIQRYLKGKTDRNPLLHYLEHRNQAGIFPIPSEIKASIHSEVKRFSKPELRSSKVVKTALSEDLNKLGRDANEQITLKFHDPIPDETPPISAIISPTETPEVFSQLAPQRAEPKAPAQSLSERASTFGLNVEGSVDVVTRWCASGWVWRPSTPDQLLEVEAILNGKIIGRTVANQHRPDLVEHNKGSGQYGFILSFSSPLEDEIAPIFRVTGPEGATVIAGPTKVHLEPGDEKNEAEAPAEKSFIGPTVEGHVDRMTRYEAVGWAWFPTAPEQTLRIEAVLDGKVIGRALAYQPRPDLAKYGKGTGLYGFEMKFDDAVLGVNTPEIRALSAFGQALDGEIRLPPMTRNDAARRGKVSVSALLDEHAAFTSKGSMFEEFDETILGKVGISKKTFSTPLMIAFYLPQFHATEENDAFWGKGFTEWRQLAKGMSRFPGHYQPRIPRDLGFYDLENIDILRAQADLAKASGIHGFGYYYYWFNQKRVLERPLEKLLASDVEMPFMLIWANENWTKTWDGSESQILLKQDYMINDEEALLDDLSRHFLDRRYIRIDNRPLFVIYNPKNIPETADTIARWRSKLITRLGVEPLMFMAQTFGDRDPRPHGLDGAIEFPPHKLSDELPGRPTPDAYSSDFAGRVIAYDDFVKTSLDEDDPDFPLIKTIVPSWDNDARRPNRGLTLEDSTPLKYQNWLFELLSRAIDAPVFGTPIVAINAWNEWAESAYLEPDVHLGAANLNATARAYVSALNAAIVGVSGSNSEAATRPAVTVIFPNFNHEKYLPQRLQSVLDQTVPPNEIIFLDDCSSDNSVEVARAILSRSNIPYRIVENTSNSGSVFRQWMKGLALARNELIWMAETDDSADRRFLSNILPAFSREDVMAVFGRITCIDQDGALRNDLDNYFDGLENFSWSYSCVVPAYQAFAHDFSTKNIIPNASGLVFRKPALTDRERDRLFQYRFAGDWYFYALVARGGSIAYCRRARSFFRVSQSSASRSSFFTKRHLEEHKMVIQDLWGEYGIGDEAINAHCDALAQNLQDYSPETLKEAFQNRKSNKAGGQPLRVCIAANGFEVGGGEILPVELANAVKGSGLHVTYLVIERPGEILDGDIRKRLRSDIPVVYWDDICEDFSGFIEKYGIQLINSHNVSVDYRFFLRNVSFQIPYLASLHGGYETVPDLLTPDFIQYLSTTVKKWLYLAKRNYSFLSSDHLGAHNLLQSFNAVPAYQKEWIDRDEFRTKHAIPFEAFVFVLCSRAIEAKGWRRAIEITERLSTLCGRPVHLVLIGDGPIAGELKAEHERSPLVTFLGQVNTPVRYFKCFDMGIFPTTFHGETFPLFLLECFQAGLPVITTDIGEIPRIMMGEAGSPPGLTVDHRIKPERLVSNFVKKLQKMFNCPEDYYNYRRGATMASQRFSISALRDFYIETFHDLTETRAESKSVVSA